MPVTATAFDRMQIRTVVDRLSDLLAPFTPDADLGLASSVPIALLPVRLEARFVANAPGAAMPWTLKVRIIPDDIHIPTLNRRLTEREVALGREFAAAPQPGDETSWNRLVRGFSDDLAGRLRAAWVARQAIAGDLQVGEPAALGAALLPDRWFVSAWNDETAVASTMSADVRRPLPVDPTRKDADLRWMTDFAEAVAAGMAVELALPEPRVDVLLVTGVRSAATPDDAARELADTLEAHRYSRGVDLLSPGTPTNNTPSSSASWYSQPDAEDLRRREFEGETPAADANAPLLSAALGLPPDDPTLASAPGGAARDQPAARAMLDTLWPVTGGEMLAVMLSNRQPGGSSVPFAVQEFVRDHASRFVRGRGPLPTLLVGRQPYGVLPVTSVSRWRAGPGDAGTFVGGLRDRLLGSWAIWEDATARLPRLGALDDPSEATELVAELLATSPVPDPAGYLVRTVESPNFSRTMPVIPVDGPLDADFATGLLDVGWIPFVADTRVSSPRAAHVVIPAVAPGAGPRLAELRASDGLLLAEVAALESAKVDVLSQLAQRSLVRSTERAAADAGGLIADALQSPALRDVIVRTAVVDLGDTVAKPVAEFTLQDLSVTTAGVELATTLEVAWRNDAVLDALALPRRPNSAERGAVLDGLDVLSHLGDDQLELLMGETLDVFANRYDAWVTSLATRRLDDQRHAPQPATGVHVGAFGWLVDVAADTSPATGAAAYVHAPSPAHAATAAVLRHADLDDRAATLDPAGTARRFDLTSATVRRAQAVLDAVRNGQPLAAVLGYRVERFLQDRGESDLIPTFRERFPLVGGESADQTHPVEAVPAHDVTDGVALWNALVGEGTLGHAALEDELRFLVDSLSDLLVAEGVHQIVRGDRSRAGATLTALARGEAPPADLHVIEPPGRHVSVPVHLTVSASAAPIAAGDGWSDDRPRALLAPVAERVARWALPPASACAFLVESPAGAVTVTLADLGICALDALAEVGASDEATDAARSDVGGLADRIRARAGVAATATLLPTAATPGAIGWAAFRSLARMWAAVLSASRPLVPADLTLEPARGAAAPPAPDTVAVEALEALVRAEIGAIAAAASAAAEALARIDAGGDAQAEAGTLAAQVAVFARAGLAGSVKAIDETDVIVARRGVPLGRDAAARLARLDQALPAPPGGLELAPRSATLVDERTERLAAIVRDVFGAAVVVAPAVVAAPAVTDQPGAVGVPGGDDLADWLGELAEVRPGVRRWWAALLASEAVGHGGPDLAGTQFPHPAGESWIGGWVGDAPAAWTPPLSARRALVDQRVDGASVVAAPGGTPVGALVVESWVEHVPLGVETEFAARRAANAAAGTVVEGLDATGDLVEATGLAVHYNSPDARPPQAVLLAVAPDPNSATWRLADVLAILLETLELTRFRAVEPPADLPSRTYLPAIFVPEGIYGLSLTGRLAELAATLDRLDVSLVAQHARSFGDG